MEWNASVINKVDEKIKTLSIKTSSKFLECTSAKQPIKCFEWYSQLVVTLTDKANVKVAFICQQLYALVLIKTLGLDNSTDTNKTYSSYWCNKKT